MMREHLLTPLLAEPVQSLSAQLQQRFALAVAQLLCADQGVEPVAVAGDAVAVEHAAHHPFPSIRWAMFCAGPGWLLPRKTVAQQFHEHQWLVDGAHAHPLGDGVPEACVGGGEALASCHAIPRTQPHSRNRACDGLLAWGVMAFAPMSDLLQLAQSERLALVISLLGNAPLGMIWLIADPSTQPRLFTA